MRKYIDDNFPLVGKNGEEIYDTVIDLCSSYTQNKVRDNDESKLFIEELLKIIPYMEDFKRKFVILRVSGLDGKLFEKLDLDNVTYDSIYNKMNELLNSLEENDDFSR